MTTLMQAMLGTDAEREPSPRIPPLLYWSLVVVITTFYLSTSFASSIALFLFQAKWVPLAGLTLIAMGMLSVRNGPTPSIGMLVVMAMLLAVAAVGSWTSVDFGYSVLTIATMACTITCAYYVSALVVATNSRRAYFELLATAGRVMIVVTALFVLLGWNLGRGSGLSAWSDNPNTLALVMTPSLLIFVAGCIERRPGWPFWHAAFFIVGFYLIWATNSRASVVWLGLSLGAFWIYRRGPTLTVFMAMIGLIILIGWWYPIKVYMIDLLGLRWSLRNNAISPLSGREEVWRIGWELFQGRPLLGYGIGSSQDLLTMESWRFVRHQGLHFHSSYIMSMVETGLLGFTAFMSALALSVGRGIADAGRKRLLPRESWPLAALPFALVVGSMGHAMFESWLLSPGNGNMMLFWTWVWMIHHQAQVGVRPVVPRAPRAPALRPAPAQ